MKQLLYNEAFFRFVWHRFNEGILYNYQYRANNSEAEPLRSVQAIINELRDERRTRAEILPLMKLIEDVDQLARNLETRYNEENERVTYVYTFDADEQAYCEYHFAKGVTHSNKLDHGFDSIVQHMVNLYNALEKLYPDNSTKPKGICKLEPEHIAKLFKYLVEHNHIRNEDQANFKAICSTQLLPGGFTPIVWNGTRPKLKTLVKRLNKELQYREYRLYFKYEGKPIDSPDHINETFLRSIKRLLD